MEIRSRVFEKYDSYKFEIPLNGREKLFVNQGGYIKKGTELFETNISTVKKSIYIPKTLDCRIEDSPKCISRINGEYIEQGEVIANRRSSGGLTVTEIIAPVSGILDLSRIGKGYADILGEESSSLFVSNFDGYINTINPTDGLIITAPAVAIDAVAMTKTENKYFGHLEILDDGKSIVTEGSLKDDYTGKIVWVGPYLYKKVAVELFERGAIALVTYAMSYEEFRNIGLPVAVLGGFGAVHTDKQFLDKFLELKDNIVVLDETESQLFVIGDFKIENSEWFVKTVLNQKVISCSPSLQGYVGKVVDIHEDSNYVLVDFDKKGTVLVHIGTLNFIDL